MKPMTFKELFLCGQDHERYVETGSMEEMERIPKNYSRIDFDSDMEKKLGEISRKINFLCVGEMWCPDCQLNLTVIKKMCEINPNFEMSVITKGRGEKFLSEALELEEVKIPTVVVLDENYNKLGLFLERPEAVKVVENFDEIKMDYLKGKYLSCAARDLMKIIEG